MSRTTTLILGVLGVLAFAAVIVLIILAATGYFKKSVPSSDPSNPCTPTITSAVFNASRGVLTLQYLPIQRQCVQQHTQISIYVTLSNGKTVTNVVDLLSQESEISIPDGQFNGGTVYLVYDGQNPLTSNTVSF